MTSAIRRRNDRLGSRIRAISVAFVALPVVLVLAGGSANAVTALNEIRYTPDIAAVLGLPATTTVTPREIGQTFGASGTVFTLGLGAIPDGTRVVAYHRRADASHLFVVDVATALGGTVCTPRDVIGYDGANYSKFFDGVAAGIPDGVRINGVALVDSATLQLSFDTTVALSGVTFTPRDIAQWNNPGFSKAFDGAAAGLPDGTVLQDFDRLSRSDVNGHLLLTFDTAGAIGALSYDRSDVLEYTPGAPGTWEINFQGTARSSGWSSADLTGVWAMASAIPPTAVTQTATGVTTAGATLHGSVNDNGADTTITFEYGLTTGYGSSAVATPNPLPGGSGGTSISATTGALVCGQTYHYRISATNNQGTNHGLDVTLQAACPPPTVVTEAATGVTFTGATLNGHVNDNGTATVANFDYGASAPAYGTNIAATPSPVGAGAGITAVSGTIAGLVCGNTYHFRVNANNGNGGTQSGADLTFATPACLPPAVVTAAADNVGSTSAMLHGSVSDNGASTTVVFEYGLTNTYGSSVAAVPGTVAGGAGTTAVAAAISGLGCGLVYHYRVTGDNGVGGLQVGADLVLTTAACVNGNSAVAVPTLDRLALALLAAMLASLALGTRGRRRRR